MDPARPTTRRRRRALGVAAAAALARRDQIPVRDPDVGLWQVQFDHRKTFSARATPRITATVNVFQTAR